MRVIWDDTELDRLTEYYLTLPLDEQRAVAATVERVNYTLSQTPTVVGESRDGRFRIWIVNEISYWYLVSDQSVRVMQIIIRDHPSRGQN